MNVDVYLFGDLGNGYTQYIDDDTRTIFKSVAAKSNANSQLIIQRDETLMYYIYVRRLQDSESSNIRYLGICYALNNRFIKDIDGLFTIFEGAITTITSRGNLLEYSNEGKIIANIGKIFNIKAEFAHISAYLKNELDSFMAGKDDTLPPLNYSINSQEIRTFKYNDERNEILNAITICPTVYIFKDNDYDNEESKSYASKLFRLNKKILQLQDTIVQQDNTISDLKKSKNKYKWVICLLSFIFIGTFAFFFYAQSKSKIIDDQTDEIKNLRSDVESKNERIQALKQNAVNLEKELRTANTIINNLTMANRLVTDSLRQAEDDLIEKDINIADLAAKLPQRYKTKYKDQYLYNKCAGEYTQASCYFSDKGSTIIIYLKEDGYGLTQVGGWIPMNRLEKY